MPLNGVAGNTDILRLITHGNRADTIERPYLPKYETVEAKRNDQLDHMACAFRTLPDLALVKVQRDTCHCAILKTQLRFGSILLENITRLFSQRIWY